MTDRGMSEEGVIGKALRWWVSELAGMVPRPRARAAAPLPIVTVRGAIATIRPPGGGEGKALSLETDEAAVFSRTVGKLSRRMTNGLHDVMLAVPEQMVLATPLSLPRAVEDDLGDVIALSLGTETPYQPEDAYHDHKIVAREGETLSVMLYSVLRGKIDALVGQLGEKGLGVVSVDILTRDGPAGVNLIRQEEEEAKRPAGRMMTMFLTFLALALGGLAIWQPLDAYSRVAAETARKADILRAEAARTTEILDAMDKRQAEFEQLAGAVSQRRTAIVLVDTLTRLLPDGTWLLDLTIEQPEVRIRGFSNAAASLIEILEASEMFEKVSFKAPTTRSTVSEVEQFDIGMTVSGGDGE